MTAGDQKLELGHPPPAWAVVAPWAPASGLSCPVQLLPFITVRSALLLLAALAAQLDFGSLYYGQAMEREVTLFNNGPVEARYVISYGTLAEMRSKVGWRLAATAARRQWD